MGYTHYFRRPTIVPRACWLPMQADIRRLVAASPIPLAYEYDDPTHKPDISSVLIRFNGVGTAGYETFCFPRLRGTREGEVLDAEGRHFQFCKTGYRPYDLIVTSALLVTKHRLKDLVVVESDGEDEDWQPARDFCLKTLGYGARFHLQGRTLVDVRTAPGAGTGEGGGSSIGIQEVELQ